MLPSTLSTYGSACRQRRRAHFSNRKEDGRLSESTAIVWIERGSSDLCGRRDARTTEAMTGLGQEAPSNPRTATHRGAS